MPPPPSGDTGEGHGEHEPTDDPVEFRPPLPPEDRIWRHPSEVAAAAALAGQSGGPDERSDGPTSDRNTVALVAAAALIGATLSIGVVAALGGFETETRVVERQVAIQPVTSLAGEDGIDAITERTAPSVAGVYVSDGDDRATGTAVVIRSDGYLLTTAALVGDATTVDVRIKDWPMLPADVVGVDGATDLAVLRVDADGDLEPAPLGTADGVRVGHPAIVVGHTHGGNWGASVDRTVVSALDRRLQRPNGDVLHGMILLDDPPAGDAHGGPLLDTSGAVVGIASGVPVAGAQPEDWYGVATPIDVAVRAADQLIEFGRVRHVWLGIEGVDLDAQTASAMSLAGGAEVADVLADSPASAAGIAAGDIVIAVDAVTVASMSELIAALRGHDPGDEVVLRVRRGEEVLEMTAALAERTRS